MFIASGLEATNHTLELRNIDGPLEFDSITFYTDFEPKPGSVVSMVAGVEAAPTGGSSVVSSSSNPATTSPSGSTSEYPGSKDLTGVIAGATVGGAVALALLGALVWWWLRRRRSRRHAYSGDLIGLTGGEVRPYNNLDETRGYPDGLWSGDDPIVPDYQTVSSVLAAASSTCGEDDTHPDGRTALLGPSNGRRQSGDGTKLPARLANTRTPPYRRNSTLTAPVQEEDFGPYGPLADDQEEDEDDGVREGRLPPNYLQATARRKYRRSETDPQEQEREENAPE